MSFNSANVKYAFIKLMMGVEWLETGKTAMDQTSGKLHTIISPHCCFTWSALLAKELDMTKATEQAEMELGSKNQALKYCEVLSKRRRYIL